MTKTMNFATTTEERDLIHLIAERAMKLAARQA